MVEDSFRIKTFSSNELDEARKKITEAKRIKREEADLRRRGGIFAPNAEEGESRRTLTRQRQSAKVKPIEKDRTSKAPFVRGNEFKKLQAKVKEAEKRSKEIIKKQEEFQKKFFDKIDFATDITTNLDNVPATISRTLGKFGPIGLIVASAIGPLISLLSKEFERGGIFSTKLKVTKDTLTVNDIEEKASVSNGTKYLTADLTIAQKIPSSSNTQNLKYEHFRYVMEDVGRP